MVGVHSVWLWSVSYHSAAEHLPTPEHWSWYSVITPFGFIGVSHVRENDKESLEIPDMLRGIVGPVKEK